MYATGKVGSRKLEVVHLRIGSVVEDRLATVKPGDFKSMRQELAIYLSQRDQEQLFTKCIETESIADENGIPFQIFYAISANSHRYFSLVNGRRVIDYQPQDNSELFFAEQIATILQQT